jgi:UDP-2,3-diacylglucosamine pyrophosphatase LpxH
MTDAAWSTNAFLGHEPAAAPYRTGYGARIPPLNPANAPRTRPIRRHRTLFISDVHLGTRGCKAELLADFLRHNACETLYLVGDIFDGWQLKRRWYWTADMSEVVRLILASADAGTKVIYIPGNHDEFLRPYCNRTIAGIEVVAEAVHVSAAGKRYLVLHGDTFDGVVECAKWLAHVGDRAYSLALALNDRLHVLRRRLGLPYWSLSAYLKRKVKKAVEYVSRYETAVGRAVQPLGVDGIICGHIHQAEVRRLGNVSYLNDGDWVESCTALAEDALGNMEILQWSSSCLADGLARAGEHTQTAAFIPV